MQIQKGASPNQFSKGMARLKVYVLAHPLCAQARLRRGSLVIGECFDFRYRRRADIPRGRREPKRGEYLVFVCRLELEDGLVRGRSKIVSLVAGRAGARSSNNKTLGVEELLKSKDVRADIALFERASKEGFGRRDNI